MGGDQFFVRREFGPYKDGIVFGADVEYKQVFQAVTKCGSYEAWLNVARECRQQSVPAKIMLAASFASPLLSIVGSLPFFVHCRSIESGTGKTVALMLAAAVWANPAPGCFIQTHNATQVGMERMATFLNQLPYCLDELQLSKDSTGQASVCCATKKPLWWQPGHLREVSGQRKPVKKVCHPLGKGEITRYIQVYGRIKTLSAIVRREREPG